MVGKRTGPLVSDTEKDAFKKRLRAALGLEGAVKLDRQRAIRLAQIAETTDAAIKAAADLEGKTKSLQAKTNSLLARHLKVDPDWLATGEGEMHSNRIWPFGDEITPAEFFQLDPADIRPALDVLTAAIKRMALGGVRHPAQDQRPDGTTG